MDNKTNNYYNILLRLDNNLYNNKITKEQYDNYLGKIIKEIHTINTKENNEQLNKYLIETGQCLNESFQVLLEDDVFTWRETGFGISIRIDGDGRTDRNFCKIPYFKIYEGKNFKTATNITRISMTPGDPFYIIYNNQIWDIPIKILKKLYIFLNTIDPDTNNPRWSEMLSEAVRVAKDQEEIKKHLSITVPRYDLGVKFTN